MKHKDFLEIDIVIPWVDGSDPAWLEERAKYSGKNCDVRPARYRDWGLMPYWFRSIEKYAPWVRKIHFITWGHVPEWLDTSNAKLHIVNHKDYIPEEYLPTFSSHPIELNIHRIEGLAEHFVYFNDDIFLTKEIKPDFFFKNGLPCDCFSLQSICFNPNSIGWINGSVMSVINKNFPMRSTLKKNWRKVLDPRNGIKKVLKTVMQALCSPWFPGLSYTHATTAYLKSTLETVWEKESEILDETCRWRFREKTNVNQYLFKFWQLVSGQFYPTSFKDVHCYHLREEWIPRVCRAIRNKEYAVICINDIGVIDDIASAASQIIAAFEDMMPEKSSFEK